MTKRIIKQGSAAVVLPFCIQAAFGCYTFTSVNCANTFQNHYYTCPNVINVKSVVGTGNQNMYQCVEQPPGVAGSLGCQNLPDIICKITVTTTYCDDSVETSIFNVPFTPSYDDGQGPCPVGG